MELAQEFWNGVDVRFFFSSVKNQNSDHQFEENGQEVFSEDGGVKSFDNVVFKQLVD